MAQGVGIIPSSCAFTKHTSDCAAAKTKQKTGSGITIIFKDQFLLHLLQNSQQSYKVRVIAKEKITSRKSEVFPPKALAKTIST